jgi:hypothetical protein
MVVFYRKRAEKNFRGKKIKALFFLILPVIFELYDKVLKYSKENKILQPVRPKKISRGSRQAN